MNIHLRKKEKITSQYKTLILFQTRILLKKLKWMDASLNSRKRGQLSAKLLRVIRILQIILNGNLSVKEHKFVRHGISAKTYKIDTDREEVRISFLVPKKHFPLCTTSTLDDQDFPGHCFGRIWAFRL